MNKSNPKFGVINTVRGEMVSGYGERGIFNTVEKAKELKSAMGEQNEFDYQIVKITEFNY